MAGCLTELTPSGAVVRSVTMPDCYPTNVCFGGSDMHTAYVTLSDTGRLGMLRWPEPGLTLNFG
jgi:gluconolactonase